MATLRLSVCLSVCLSACLSMCLSIFFSQSQPSQIECLPYFYTWCGPSANLECRSEMWCTRLAGNVGRKKSSKIRHLRTIKQLCRAISLQWKHVLTIGKKVNFGPITAEICWQVWGIPANLNGFRVLAPLLHGTLIVGVIKTLRHWTDCATYIRQGGHHVGHWPTF